VQNAVIRRAVFRGLEMFGTRNGFAGLIGGDFRPLGPRDVARISHLGGTMLGTARCDEFRTDAGIEKAYANLCDRDVDGLVVIGGNCSRLGSSKRLVDVFGHPRRPFLTEGV
jgi:6-phosphofructokinase 1